MKVILSRKGFDSQYGGVPSPIFHDGTFVSLPIGDKTYGIPYHSIQHGGRDLGSLVEGLSKGSVKASHLAHLDPDLDASAIPRKAGWRPIFGQSDAALGHLKKQGVGPSDLFLFFGWFRRVVGNAGEFRYVRGDSPVHMIWGWMIVGAFYECAQVPAQVRSWAGDHPHLKRPTKGPDGIFVGADQFSIGAQKVSGAGVFPFAAKERVLTRPGGNVSVWSLLPWMHPRHGSTSLSYHLDPERWTDEEGGEACALRTVGKGQEFVLSTTEDAGLCTWLESIFQDCR